jgi:hypothetical protein
MKNIPNYNQFLNEDIDMNSEVEIIDKLRPISFRYFKKDPSMHRQGIVTLMLNAYQAGIKFSEKDLDKIEKAWKLMKK